MPTPESISDVPEVLAIARKLRAASDKLCAASRAARERATRVIRASRERAAGGAQDLEQSQVELSGGGA
jgi:hypothetical protein